MKLKSSISLPLVAAAAMVVLTAGAVSAPAQADRHDSAASPQVVLDWNETTLATVLAAGKAADGPLYVSLAQAAAYDAVVAIEGGFEPYLVVPGVPPGSSPEAAAVAATHGVLVSYFPAQKPMLDAAYTESLAAVPDGPGEERGILVGQQVATGIVAARIDDGRDAPVPFDPPLAPGVWRPTPPAFVPALQPWLARTKPLLLESPSQFRPGPPPALGSRRYARDFEETRKYGALDGSLRTPEQTETARFWLENSLPQFNRVLRNLVTSRGLSLGEAARTLALANTVMADALQACWDAKYTYAAWRPVTAIPAADTDGNDRTKADPGWQSLVPTPPHPEYPSAHNCVTGSFGEVVASLLGSHRIELDVDSTSTGTTRHYAHVNDLRRDIHNARVYAGFHWRTSDEVGYRLGQRVAHWALQRYFEKD